MGYGQNDLKINVSKKLLLDKLTANRENFKQQYEEAKNGYRKALIDELQNKLKQANNGEKVELGFENQPPKNQLSDYDDVIGMLEWSTDETIQLNHEQYKNYVDDNWDWKNHWSLSNSVYLSQVG